MAAALLFTVVMPSEYAVDPTGLGAVAPLGKADRMTVSLNLGEGKEVKLEMVKGANVRFEWSASGRTVNFDTL